MSQRTILHVQGRRPSHCPPHTGTRAPEGALAGAGLCIVFIGAIGWLAGIGALCFPWIDSLTNEGPGVAALCGIVVGATIGGIAGCLAGRRISNPPRPPQWNGENLSAPDRADSGPSLTST